MLQVSACGEEQGLIPVGDKEKRESGRGGGGRWDVAWVGGLRNLRSAWFRAAKRPSGTVEYGKVAEYVG